MKLLCERLAPHCALHVLVAHASFRSTREIIDGVDVIRMGRLLHAASTSICPRLPGLLRKLRPDIVHIHLPNPWAEWCYLAAGSPGRLVVSFHSDIIRQQRLLRLHAPVHRRFLKRAARIIVATPNHVTFSPFLSAEVAERCVVIPYGIDPTRFAATPQVCAQARQLRARLGHPLVLFVGSLVYYKGLDVLIDAVRATPVHVALVGAGPLAAALRRHAREAGVAERVHFLGELDDATLLAAYHACDVFCLPSTWRSEAFGIVQLEAFACGKPVISTNLPSGVPWVNRHEETGLIVEPGRADALAAALQRLVADEALRLRLGGNAAARVQCDFSADAMAAATLRLYEQVMCERHTVARHP
jgi:rhamnosyl/mannosyltransferase